MVDDIRDLQGEYEYKHDDDDDDDDAHSAEWINLDEIWSIKTTIKSPKFAGCGCTSVWLHIPISYVVSDVGWFQHLPTFCSTLGSHLLRSTDVGFRRRAGSTSLDPSVVDKISLSEMYIDDPDYYTLVPLGSCRLRHNDT